MGKIVIAIFGAMTVAAAATATARCVGAPLVLHNVSPSSPLGLYRYAGALPDSGDYIAFRAVGPGFERITDAAGLPMPSQPMLKPIGAYPGDRVCYQPAIDSYRINGGAPIGFQKRAWRGRQLPIWRGCRAMTDREYFTHAGRIPNALDSRFYGPVDRSLIIGAYRPLRIEDAVPADRRIAQRQGDDR